MLRHFFLLFLLALPARADVVVNEIMYHAPNDLDNLQFVELHNTGDKAVDLAGWKLKGAKYDFPAGAKIEAGGFLVLCKNLKEFKKHYGLDAGGELTGKLSHSGERIELLDAAGKKIDSMKYGSRAPWPVSPDGSSPSLERICPTMPGDDPHNWAPSPMPNGPPKPTGTPGKANSVFSAKPLPVVSNLSFAPQRPKPNEEIRVTAIVKGAENAELLYRVAASGTETKETAVPMAKGANDTFSATIPGQQADRIIRMRVRAADVKGAERFFPHANDLRPALSAFVHDTFEAATISQGYILNLGAEGFGRRLNQFFGGSQPNPSARGRSAYVHVDPKTGESQLFDFISVTPRNGGRKVRFHKDQPLDGMTTINLIYEYMDRFPLAEHLSYEVYRKAGAPAPRSGHVRTFIDGKPIGFQLMVEQVNKSYLRHNGYDANGNLYKAVWWADNVVSRHEKKTHVHDGHADLVELVQQLNKTKGDEQWKVIEKHFDVKEMANHYAVRTILSDWDGFFNNYFLYHDTAGTGKWTLHPWDQDKSQGFHDGIQGFEVFFDMPLTYAKQGDIPPGKVNFGFGGPIWWRMGGDISKPLLANPEFRKRFLVRVKELLETVYTEEKFFPVIKVLEERLEPEIKHRAQVLKQDPKQATEVFRKHFDSLRDHLKKRREFLLAQEELKAK